jgi:hypothetical protein
VGLSRRLQGYNAGPTMFLNPKSEIRNPKQTLVFLILLPLLSAVGLAQPKNPAQPPPPIEPAEGERQAHALLSTLLAQKPDRNVTNSGVLKIRDADHHEREVPVRFQIMITPTNWVNDYETGSSGNAGNSSRERLTIVHTEGAQDRYLLQTLGGPNSTNAVRTLSGNQLVLPFAGSDFWAVDLGLEFLRWPQQRILRKEMRRELFCDVLQSTNPHPAPGAYSRVVSWIAANRPEDIVIVHADAYDANNKLLKEFTPKKVEKINGVWQLEEMELRNRQTDSRTRIEFNLR